MPNEVLDTDLAIALGQVRGAYHLSFFGYNPSISQGVPEDVWPIGGTYVFPPDTGETCEVVSTDPLDTSSVYRIRYMDVDFKVKDQFVQLNGTTPIPLNEPISRMMDIFNVSSVRSAGTVQVQGDGTLSTNIYCAAPTEDQTSLQAIRTIPAGKIGVLRAFDVSLLRTGPDAELVFRGGIRIPGVGGSRGIRIEALRYGVQQGGNTISSSDLKAPYVLTEKTDIVIEAESDTNDVRAGCFVQLTLFDSTQADIAAYLKT